MRRSLCAQEKQRIEKVFCGVGKGGENEDFFVGVAELISRGVFNFAFDGCFNSLSFASRPTVTAIALS